MVIKMAYEFSQMIFAAKEQDTPTPHRWLLYTATATRARSRIKVKDVELTLFRKAGYLKSRKLASVSHKPYK